MRFPFMFPFTLPLWTIKHIDTARGNLVGYSIDDYKVQEWYNQFACWLGRLGLPERDDHAG